MKADNAPPLSVEEIKGLHFEDNRIREVLDLSAEVARLGIVQNELKGKPFPQEEELKQKSMRLAELNAELNIDDRTPLERAAESTVAKSARSSVLDKLKTPGIPGAQPKKKSYDMEER